MGHAYERYVGRWSRLVAREFVGWLALPTGARWLDVGCGTGVLSATILDRAAPREVIGVDSSPGFVAFARQHVVDSRAHFETGDAQSLPYAAGAFDAVVSGLVLNFIPQPGQAMAEMARVARAGGAVGAYVWDYSDHMQMVRTFWDAATALDPSIRNLDQGVRFPLCNPEPLTALLADAGLTNVEVRAIDVPTLFRDFDDYWTPFLGGQGAAPTYLMRLSEEQRAALRDRLKGALPRSPDGSISLRARAWVVQGIR